MTNQTKKTETTEREFKKANGILGTYTIDENGLCNVQGSVYLMLEDLIKIPIPFGTVSGNFSCSKNYLTSLENAPIKVGKNFWCYSNKLTTLKNAPKEVGGYFNCVNNSIGFTEEEVRTVCFVGENIYA